MVRPGISSREGMAGIEDEGGSGGVLENPVQPTAHRTRSPRSLHLDTPQSCSEPARGAALDNNQLTPPHSSSRGQTQDEDPLVPDASASSSPPVLIDETQRKTDSHDRSPSSSGGVGGLSQSPQVAVVNSYLGPMNTPTLYSGKKTRIASVSSGNGNQQRTVLLLNSAITNSPLLTGNGGLKQQIALLSSSGSAGQDQRLAPGQPPPPRRHSTQEVAVDGPELTSTKTSFVTSASRGLVPRLTHSRTINKGQPAFIQTQPIRRGVFAIGNRRLPPGHTYWATKTVNSVAANGQHISSTAEPGNAIYPHSIHSNPSSSSSSAGLRPELMLNSGPIGFRSRTHLTASGKETLQPNLSSTPNSPRAGITVKVSPNEPPRPGQGVTVHSSGPSTLASYPHLRSALSADDASSPFRISLDERAVMDHELLSSPSPTLSADSDSVGISGRQRRLRKRAAQLSSRVAKTMVEKQTGSVIGGQIMDFILECDNATEPSPIPADTSRPSTPPPSSDSVPSDSKKLLSPKNILLEKKLEALAKAMEDPRAKSSSSTEGTAKTAADLSRLVRRYDVKKFGNMLTPNASAAFGSERNLLSLSPGEAISIGNSSRGLTAHLRQQQRQCDPEATESSSGGESCDEWDEARRPQGSRRKSSSSLPTVSKEQPDLEKRAGWRWMRDRSRLGSRWGWLQSHMSDLEYKIRQHVDICRQIRARKQPIPTLTRPSEGGSDEKAEETCARVRPAFIRSRRKLVASVGSHRWNRKAGREGSVGCGCFPPLPPCIMCSGRIHPTATHPDLCSQTLWERIGVVDHSFNPVLSSHHRGLSLDKKILSHLKQRGSSSRTSPLKSSSSSGPSKWEDNITSGENALKRSNADLPDSSPPKKKLPPLKIRLPTSNDHHRSSGDGSKSSKSGPNSLEATSSTGGRTREKYSKKRLLRESRSNSRSRATTPDSGDESGGEDDDDSWDDEYFDSFGSSIESPGKYSGRRLASVGSVQTYDIDNIVIDPSVAAVCRVEKLQYKEIEIPAWRENTLESNQMQASNRESDSAAYDEIEDLNDDTFELRHSEKESEERKKFQLYKQSLWGPGMRKPFFDSDVFDTEGFERIGNESLMQHSASDPSGLHSRFFPDSLPIGLPAGQSSLNQESVSAEPSPSITHSH